jgi:hypothetical protein
VFARRHPWNVDHESKNDFRGSVARSEDLASEKFDMRRKSFRYGTSRGDEEY